MTANQLITDSGMNPDNFDVEIVLIYLAQGKFTTAVNHIAQSAGCTTRQATHTARTLADALRQGHI